MGAAPFNPFLSGACITLVRARMRASSPPGERISAGRAGTEATATCSAAVCPWPVLRRRGHLCMHAAERRGPAPDPRRHRSRPPCRTPGMLHPRWKHAQHAQHAQRVSTAAPTPRLIRRRPRHWTPAMDVCEALLVSAGPPVRGERLEQRPVRGRGRTDYCTHVMLVVVGTRRRGVQPAMLPGHASRTEQWCGCLGSHTAGYWLCMLPRPATAARVRSFATARAAAICHRC